MTSTRTGISNQEGVVVREVSRPGWSPAQVIVLLGGLLLLVLGAVGLAHTGLRFSDIPTTRTRVADLPVTSLSSLVELVAGVIVLAGAAFPTPAKVVGSIFGVLALAWGLIVALDPSPFSNMWGYDRAEGIFYIVVGAVLLVVSALSPVYTSRKNVMTTLPGGPGYGGPPGS